MWMPTDIKSEATGEDRVKSEFATVSTGCDLMDRSTLIVVLESGHIGVREVHLCSNWTPVKARHTVIRS